MNGSRHRPLVKTRLQISERPPIGIFGRQSARQVLLYLENYDKLAGMCEGYLLHEAIK